MRERLGRRATTYTATLPAAQDFGPQVLATAQRRGLGWAHRVAVLGASAKWIRKLAARSFPQAVQIVDWYHARAQLWALAQLLYGAGMAAAQAAARGTHTYLGAQYRRLAPRRGAKTALIAVAHSLLEIAYHVLMRHEPYRDPRPNYFDEREREVVQHRLVRRLERLGYRVSLEPAA